MKSRASRVILSLAVVLSIGTLSSARAAVDAFIWFDKAHGGIVQLQGSSQPIDVASYQFSVSGGISSPSIGADDFGQSSSVTYSVKEDGAAVFPFLSPPNIAVSFGGTVHGPDGSQPAITDFTVQGGDAGSLTFDVYATIDQQHRLQMQYTVNPIQTGFTFHVDTATHNKDLHDWVDVTVGLDGSPSGSVDFTQPLFFVTMTSVPEPSSLVLAAFGFAGLGAWAWRRRRRPT